MVKFSMDMAESLRDALKKEAEGRYITLGSYVNQLLLSRNKTHNPTDDEKKYQPPIALEEKLPIIADFEQEKELFHQAAHNVLIGWLGSRAKSRALIEKEMARLKTNKGI